MKTTKYGIIWSQNIHFVSTVPLTRKGSLVSSRARFLQPDSTVDIYEDEINAFYLEKIVQLTPRTEHIFEKSFFAKIMSFQPFCTQLKNITRSTSNAFFLFLEWDFEFGHFLKINSKCSKLSNEY